MTPDDQDDAPAEEEALEAPDEDEVPPVRFVKIEDFVPDLATVGDAVSPLEHVNGRSLTAPDAVAVALVSGEDEDGVFLGETLAEMSFVIGELGGRQGAVLVDDFAVANSFSIAFKSGAPAERPEIRSPASRELNGAALLMQVLSSRTTHDLFRNLGSKGRTASPRLETLLRLLFEHKATLDIQTPHERPIRVTYERAAALYHALREPMDKADQSFMQLGHLVGAFFDTRQFRLRLSEPWNRKRVIEGRFGDSLRNKVHEFLNGEVLAEVAVEEGGMGAHGSRPSYTLVSLREPPRLPAT